MTTQDKATSRAESGEAVEVLLDGFRLVKESALDRLRMDDEIVSIVDYHANKARALLASRPVESAKTVPMDSSIIDALTDLSTLDERAHKTGKYSIAVEYAASLARRILDHLRTVTEGKIDFIKLESEVKALRVCGNCEHGKSTSLDDTRCYQNTPYLPTGRHCAGCPDWKRAAIVANPRAALQGGK
jgi:hypothetical protein